MLQLYAEACVYSNKETNDFDSVIDLNSYFLEFFRIFPKIHNVIYSSQKQLPENIARALYNN